MRSPTLAALACLALAATPAAAKPSPWCEKKQAECAHICGSAASADFDCLDKGGSRSWSCSCTATGVRFGSGVRVEGAAPSVAVGWWPSWLSPAAPSSTFPLASESPDASTPAALPPPPPDPLRNLAISLVAGVLTLALVAALAGAGVALARLVSACCPRARARSPPTGAAASYMPAPAAAGLDDVEAGEAAEAVPLKGGKA